MSISQTKQPRIGGDRAAGQLNNGQLAVRSPFIIFCWLDIHEIETIKLNIFITLQKNVILLDNIVHVYNNRKVHNNRFDERLDLLNNYVLCVYV